MDAQGRKTGGRVKGTPNRDTITIEEKLRRADCDPIPGMATIAENKLPCGVCRGKGRTKYKLPEPKPCECKRAKDCPLCSGTGTQTLGERTCESCYGTLFEACSPELRGKMYSGLSEYVAAKRKAVELSTPNGALQVNLSNLTDEELLQLEKLSQRVTPRA